MGLFYDPIEGPPSNKQKLGIILYAVLALISIWATGESLSKTFDFPIWISYLVGLAVVLIMAAMLSIIKNAIEERNLVPLFVGLISFFIVWGISLTTNTHNFYLKGSLKDIQEEELEFIKTELEGIKVNSFSIVNEATNVYRLEVSNKINNYKNEVTNNNNPGHGPVADSLKRIVEKSMPGTQFPIPSRTHFNTIRQRIDFADKMGTKMMTELNTRIASMDQKKQEIDSLISTNQYQDILNEVIQQRFSVFNSSVLENRNVIAKSYSFYNSLKDKVNRILELPDPTFETPGSIQLEHISKTYGYVKNQNGFRTAEFLFSFMIALGVDIGAFAIFYFMILKKD